MNHKPYIEVSLFKLKDGVTANDYLAAADANLADFQKIDGFMRRELCQSEDGQWLDMVYWADRATAKQAEDVLGNAPSIHTIMGMMAMESGTWLHVEPTRTYEA